MTGTTLPQPGLRLPGSAARLFRRLGSQSHVLSLADQALVSGTNMCTTIIIARTCGKPELGLFASGYSLLMLVQALQTALILTPYTVLSPRFHDTAHRYYKGSAVLHSLTLSALVSIAFGVSGLLLQGRGPRDGTSGILFALAAMTALIAFRDCARKLSYAELRFRDALLIDAAAGFAQVSMLILLAFWGKLAAPVAFLAMGVACGTPGLIWLLSIRRTVAFSIHEARNSVVRNWHFGRWLFAGSLLWSISTEQYPWIIVALHSTTEAAVWASCVGVVGLLNPLVTALNNEAAPRIAHGFAAGGLALLRRTVVRSAATCAMVTLPILVGLAFFGDRLVMLMYGPAYGGSALLLTLIAAGAVVSATGVPFPYGLLALDRPKLDFVGNIAALIAVLAFGLWAVRAHGALGAGFALLAATSAGALARAAAFLRASALAGRATS